MVLTKEVVHTAGNKIESNSWLLVLSLQKKKKGGNAYHKLCLKLV